MNLICRLARPAERGDLEDLQRRASLVDVAYRDQLLAHPEAIELPASFIAEGLVIVAERGDRPVGLAVVLRPLNGRAELDGLFVDPSDWRQGIGTMLIGAALAHAQAAGARDLELRLNSAQRYQ